MKKVLSVIKKIPGYLITVPLLIGMLINLGLSSMPAASYESYENVAGTIVTVLIFILVFGVCTQLNFRKLGKGFAKGGVLLLLKFGIAALVGILMGGVWGLSTLALVAAMSNNNNAIYATLAQDFGDKDESDMSALSVLCLCNSYAFTLIIVASNSASNIDAFQIIMPFIPIALGIAAGNIWPKIQPILFKVAGATLPVLGLVLGSTISIRMAVVEGGFATGLIIGVFTLAIGVVAFFVSRVYMGKGKFSPMAIGIGCTAGSAIAVPATIANIPGIAPEIAAIAKTAAAQVTGCMILTAILVPVLVSVFHKWEQKRRAKKGIEPIVTAKEWREQQAAQPQEPVAATE